MGVGVVGFCRGGWVGVVGGRGGGVQGVGE